MKSTARIVIVGGGVVGVGLLYGLARRGCSDAVLCEQHELTSGSTWHAAGLVQKYIHDRFTARIVSKTIEIFESLEEETGQAPGWHRCGSLRIASTRDRADEFRKYMDRCEALGLPAEWITPDEAIEHWPLIARRDLIAAAVWNPDDGHVAPADATMALAAGARALGAEICRETKVVALARMSNGEWEVTTSKGTIRCEHVVLATGMYARETSSALLDLRIPAVPIVHQYMVTEPLPILAERKRQGRPELPILKADTVNGYVREEGGGLLFGPYEDGDDLELFGVDGVPEGFAGALLPELLGPVEGHIEALLDLVPAYGEVGIRSNVRGPINLTPDGYPLVGPAPGHDNAWLAEGFTGGPTMGAGVGFYLSEWILDGEPGIDFIRADPRRYGPWATRRFACARNREKFGDNFGIHYPDYQMKTARGVKRFPVHDAYAAAGAVWASDQGWELPAWFAPQGVEPIDRYSYRRANYFPHVGAECRAVREAAGLMNLSNLAKFEVSGPGAQSFLDRFLANRLPSTPGRVRLGHHLTAGGGIAAEYVVSRLGDEHFYLTGTARLHAHHLDLLVRAMPRDGSVRIEDVTMRRGVFVVAGPNARAVLEPLADAELSNASFPWMRAKTADVGYASDVVMVRANYTGELGWELHHPIEYSASLHESLVEAGRAHGLRLVGMRALESLRLEKSYRSMISDLDSETSPLDAGMERFVALDKGEFTGRAGYLVRQQAGPVRRFSVLDVEPGDADATGEEGIYHGSEPVGSVASGGYSHTLDRLLVHTYLPVAIANPGTELTVSVLMERRAARVIAESPYDPENRRPRGEQRLSRTCTHD